MVRRAYLNSALYQHLSLQLNMIRQFHLLLVSAAILLASCSSQKRQASFVNNLEKPSSQLKIRMESPMLTASKDSIILIFTVINETDKPKQFVKWETPFEPRLGKYFEIKDKMGKEPEFRGPMARRVMPPPPGAYIEVPAHDQVQTKINLADNYHFEAGLYTVTYIGSGVSGLKPTKSIKIKVGNFAATR